MYRLLIILTSLSVTNTTSEEPLPTHRHLKTYLRNTMSEDRLNKVTLQNMRRDIEVFVKEVIENPARKSSRLIRLI